MERDVPETGEVLETLRKRRPYLLALREEPADIRDLRDAVGNARSTVYTGIRELEAARLVVRSDGGYRLTQFGQLALRRFESFRDDLDALAEAEPALPHLGPEPTLPPSVVVDATLITRDGHAPDRPIDTFEAEVREATALRGFAPVTRARYMRLFEQEVGEGDLEATLLTEQRVVEYLLENHADTLRPLLDGGDYELYETDRSLPFGLVLFDEPESHLGMSLYDGDQRLSAYLRTDSEAAFAWGEETFERYRANATALTPTEGAGGD